MHREVLDPLDDEAAKHILGDVDNAEAILARLGGHPLALQLHRPGMTLPEEGEGIEAFVTNAVLADLSKDERGAVEALALLPLPSPGMTWSRQKPWRTLTSVRSCCGGHGRVAGARPRPTRRVGDHG